MRAGGDRRLNSRDRKRLREWIFMVYSPELGPDLVKCQLGISKRCHGALTRAQTTFDRVVPGGPYNRSNVQPACYPCQWRQGGLVSAERRRQWLTWMDEARATGVEWDGAM